MAADQMTRAKPAIYVATPITGIPEMNLPMVRRIERVARQQYGFTPVIPHDIPAHDHEGPCPEAESYPGVTIQGSERTHGGLCYLRSDLRVMLACDEVVVAPGWPTSRGALVEIATAKAVGMRVRYFHPMGSFFADFPTHTDHEAYQLRQMSAVQNPLSHCG